MEPDIFADAIARTFTIDAERNDWRCTSTELLEVLRTFAGISKGHDKAQGREVAVALRKHWGIEGKRSNGATVYCGLQNKAAGEGKQCITVHHSASRYWLDALSIFQR